MIVGAGYEVKIVEAESPASLSTHINNYIEQGWSLDTQSLTAVSKGQYSTYHTYCVVMTKPTQRPSNV